MSPGTRTGKMGTSQSKNDGDKGDQLSPLMKRMTKQYGQESCCYLGKRCKDYMFPDGGSFSKRQIDMLREKLESKETQMRKKKKSA